MKLNFTHFAAVATIGLLTAPAVAQNSTDPAVSTVPVNHDRDDDDRDFPWGLLGLAGLAGLLGRKRDNDHHDHRAGTNNANR